MYKKEKEGNQMNRFSFFLFSFERFTAIITVCVLLHIYDILPHIMWWI